MQRVSVVGTSGSGKTTTARRLAAKLGLPYIELDAIYHQPNWQELPRDEFRGRVAEAAAVDAWVIDGNYNSLIQDLVLARADTLVWLDLPRSTVMRQVTARTLRRAITREVLWNGNREPLTNFYRWKPEKNIIRWAWTRHAEMTARYEAVLRDPAFAHLELVRLRTRAEITDYLT